MLRIFFELSRSIFGLIWWIALFSTVSIPLGFLYIWKKIAYLCAKCLEWSGIRKFIPLDAMDVESVTGILNNQSSGAVDSTSIGFLLKMEGALDVYELRQHFIKTFPRGEAGNWRYDRLYYTIQQFMGYPFFRELQSLDFTKQIYGVKLGKETILEDYLSSWIKKPYPEGNACWEIVVLPQGMAFKIHHSIADGYSAVQFLDKLTGLEYKFSVKENVKKAGNWEKIRVLSQSSFQLDKLSANPNLSLFQDLPLRRWELAIYFGELDLPLLKQIRRQLNVQLASILITIYGSALLTQFCGAGNKNVPDGLNIGLALPWTGHPYKKAMHGKQIGKGGVFVNQWIPTFTKMPSGGSLLDKVFALEESFANLQASGLTTVNMFIIYPALSLLPTRVLRWVANSNFGITTAASFVIGGDKYHILGRKVTNINPIMNLTSIQSNLVCCSHDDRFEYTLHGNLAHFPGGREEFNKLGKSGMQAELAKLKTEVDNFKYRGFRRTVSETCKKTR